MFPFCDYDLLCFSISPLHNAQIGFSRASVLYSPLPVTQNRLPSCVLFLRECGRMIQKNS